MKKTIDLSCFWCGNKNGLAAEIEEGYDLPEDDVFVVDYNPCDDCLERWNTGAACIFEVVTEPMSGFDKPIETQDDISYFPTGRYAIVANEWLETFLKNKTLENVKENKFMLVGPDIFEMFFNEEIKEQLYAPEQIKPTSNTK